MGVFTVSLGSAKSSSGYFTGSFTDQTGELQNYSRAEIHMEARGHVAISSSG